jgi:hypothetical protein
MTSGKKRAAVKESAPPISKKPRNEGGLVKSRKESTSTLKIKPTNLDRKYGADHSPSESTRISDRELIAGTKNKLMDMIDTSRRSIRASKEQLFVKYKVLWLSFSCVFLIAS